MYSPFNIEFFETLQNVCALSIFSHLEKKKMLTNLKKAYERLCSLTIIHYTISKINSF